MIWPKPRGWLGRLLVPSLASAAVHVVLLAAVLVATISITQGQRRRAYPLAEIAVGPEAPIEPPEPAPSDGPEGGSSHETLAMPEAPAIASRSVEVNRAALASVQPRSSASDAMVREQSAQAQSVSFAGVSAKAARRIVYVVDTSGSMVNSHAFVRARLIQSIRRLSPTQSFSVVLARQESDEAGLEMLPCSARDPLVRALPSEKDAAVEWLRDVVVGGRSAPLAGLQRALSIKPRPDLIFLLSRGFRRTDSGGAWGSVEGALAELDSLNPRSARTGQRPVVIKTIQFLDEDPTGLMEAIADAHGDGPGSFRVLTMKDLAEEGAESDAIPPDAAVSGAIEEARQALARADGPDLIVLYGLASDEERATVEQAIERVREILGPKLGEGDSAGVLIRARADLLDAAMHDDRAAAGRAREALAEMFVVDVDADAARRLSLAAAMALAGDLDAAGRVADALASDARVLDLSENIVSELRVLRARFGLGEPAGAAAEDWALLEAEARVKHALTAADDRSDAFDPLLAWAGDDGQKRAIAWRLVAQATTGMDAADLEPRVRFARAMGLAAEGSDEAVALLMSVADAVPASRLGRESLWEAGVRLQQREPARAAGVLEQFARSWAKDARASDAVSAAIADTPSADERDLARRLRLALELFPTRPEANVWRVRLAQLSDSEQALALLGQVPVDAPEAGAAAARAYAIGSDAAASVSAAREAAGLLRAFGDGRWQRVQAALVEKLISSHAEDAVVQARLLDQRDAQHVLLLARALRAAGRRNESLEALDRLAKRLRPNDEMYWQTWSVLLDELSSDPKEADVVRAHLYRLRLIDPDFGVDRWPELARPVAESDDRPG